MKIGNISNNTSFGKIYTVIGGKKDMSQLRIHISDVKKETNNPAMVYNLTNHSTVPKATKDKLKGRQLCVVVTGEESLKSTNKLAGSQLSSFLIDSADKIIKLGSNVKNDAVEILQSIKHNK